MAAHRLCPPRSQPATAEVMAETTPGLQWPLILGENEL